MDLFSLQDLLKKIEYKEGYAFYPYTQYDRQWMYLEVCRVDVVTGKVGIGRMPATIIEKDWGKDQILRQALKTIIQFEEHEIREHFKYQGKAIFGPHVKVDDLLKAIPDVITHPEGKSGAW